MKITLETFTKNLADKNNISVSEAKRISNMVFGSLEDMLLEGNGCTFNVGTFSVSDVKERSVTINFGERRGEKTVVPAHKKITFTPNKKIRFAYKNYKAD